MVPKNKDLKEILSYGNVSHKALFLTMATSGIRPGEAISITFNDVYLDENPARIQVPFASTRTKESRTTFISSEAKHWLTQWLKIRTKYIKSKRNKVPSDDERIFPFTNTTMPFISKKWQRLIPALNETYLAVWNPQANDDYRIYDYMDV